MIEMEVTRQWHEIFPGAHIGVLLMGNADNSKGRKIDSTH
jgi:hypothetical protein